MLAYNSCDILRTSHFEVLEWSPGNGFHSAPEEITVFLDFSHEANRASVERNFSLAGNGNRVRGTFSWENKKVTFTPLTPLETNTDYIINLSADAYDIDGLNMDDAFRRSFTTRPSGVRPVLLSCLPSVYSEVSDLRQEVKLEFSVPVPAGTLYENVSFSPSMTGFWRLKDGEKTAIFTPAEPWMQNNRYEIRISSSLTDNNGMSMGVEFSSVFSTRTDREIPSLLHVSRVTMNENIIPLSRDSGAAQQTIENSDWEKNDRLLLVFSKPVDRQSVKNCISAENGPGLIMENLTETPADFGTEFIFRLESIPLYESRFTVRIRQGIKDSAGNESNEEHIYRIFANGKFSKPPSLAGIRMPMAPESDTNQELVSFQADSLFEIIPINETCYPFGESVKTWIELYFDTAEGASVNLFSVMELFRIDTSNNVINFSPRQVKHSDFSAAEPRSGWENFQRVEISGYLVNSANFGIVYFLIAAGLRDDSGNRNENQFRISLVK